MYGDRPLNAPVPETERVPHDTGSDALRPYAGTSGWSGSAASETRARTEDAEGITSQRQRAALNLIQSRGFAGITVKELRQMTGWHHGQASGALSVLHKEGVVLRLSEQRERCHLYVLPGYEGDRTTEDPGRVVTVEKIRQAVRAVLASDEHDPYEIRQKVEFALTDPEEAIRRFTQ